MSKKAYLEMLNNSYARAVEWHGEISKLEYLADEIFGFVTYENVIAEMMAEKCIEVCKAISDRKTFDYIATEEGNMWYLIMVNMPFLKNKISWGTSIRGAFWYAPGTMAENNLIIVKSCGLFNGDEQILKLGLDLEQWNEFVDAIIEFAGK